MKLSSKIDDKRINIYRKGSGYPVASVDYDVDHDEAERLARLFCAAPDLLKALKRFVHIYDRQGANGCGQTVQPVPPEIAAARAAIAKATGES